MVKKTENGSADIISVTATPLNHESLRLGYEVNTPSNLIVTDSTSFSGMNLEHVHLEEITETFERSKGLLGGGGKLSLKLPDWAGGGAIEFERLPKSTIKRTKKITYRSPLLPTLKKPKK
jgi:hypothetical protein